MSGWRMLIWLLATLGLALAAVWSLLSVGSDGSATEAIHDEQPGESQDEIGEESRRALRDLLREVDSGGKD